MQIKVLDDKSIILDIIKSILPQLESISTLIESLEWYKVPSDLTVVPGNKNLVLIRLGGYYSGIAVAKNVKQMDPNTMILFFSKTESYALESYEFHPVDYLIEPIDRKRLCAAIERVSELMDNF